MGTREVFNEGGVRWDGGVAFQTYPLTEESGQELNEALKSTKLSRNPEISVEILKSFVKSGKSIYYDAHAH